MGDSFVHPTAIVETRQIGPGTKIWAFTHILESVSIGTNCTVGDHCFIESGVVIGNNVTIKNGNMIWKGITLQDGVFVGPGVVFTNDRYPRSPRLSQAQKRYSNSTWLAPTLVQQGVSLGAGAVILAGVTIGQWAMVGAGAVVTKNVLPYTLVFGNPARVQGWVCRCGAPLKFREKRAACGDCSLHYVKDNDAVLLSTL
jgi:UDP-2-acetamido-3-amino-2,3-dideoxy-glucuronate N-acetyltransferase